MIMSGTIKLPFDDPFTGVPGAWDLNAGTGPRSYVSPDIQFALPGSSAKTPFGGPPHVVVSLAGIEATTGPPSVGVIVQNVQAEEFNIQVVVSGNCALNWLWVTWTADDGA